MRAAELDQGSDERTNPSTVMYYAPRRRIAADGASIRPVLERLSRGDRRAHLVEAVPPAPAEEPIGVVDTAAARARALAIAVRCAAVTGVGVGLAAVVAFMLHNPQRQDRAPLATTLPAKSVQTVSYKSQERIDKDGASLPAVQTHDEPLREAANGVVPGSREAGDAPLPAAFASWAMAPPALPPARWSEAEQSARDAAVAAVEPAAAQAEPVAPEPAEHPAVKPHRHHARSHRHRHAAAAQPEQTAEAPEAPGEKTEAVPKPVDNSLRSVLDKMFRPD
ncbi:MAG TPA: hypothetical protein VFW22_05910 [Pseudolabrys sp.]|nr:hypothetical protein [Pseudolabrys sp.]